jgi:hypothetical protein
MNILDRIAAKLSRRVEPTAVAVGSTDGPGPAQAPNAASIAVDVEQVEQETAAETEQQPES